MGLTPRTLSFLSLTLLPLLLISITTMAERVPEKKPDQSSSSTPSESESGSEVSESETTATAAAGVH